MYNRICIYMGVCIFNGLSPFMEDTLGSSAYDGLPDFHVNNKHRSNRREGVQYNYLSYQVLVHFAPFTYLINIYQVRSDCYCSERIVNLTKPNRSRAPPAAEGKRSSPHPPQKGFSFSPTTFFFSNTTMN